jgi:hypothetical protein
MARYYAPWNHREQAYYALLYSKDIQSTVPWYDWFPALAPLVTSIFPFSLIEPGDTVVQVGANRNQLQTGGGSQPLLLAQCVGQTGRVIAIDSEAVNVEAILQARERLNLPCIEVHQYTVSDGSGEVDGIDVDGHTFFWDPDAARAELSSAAGGTAVLTSREASPDLKAHWDFVDKYGKPVKQRTECLETILETVGAPHPKLVNFTINGYEPVGIRGMRSLLDQDVIIPFVARVTEAFWGNGFLEELESHGFDLVLSNIPHSKMYGWFPYITALRSHHLKRRPNAIPGSFALDEQQQVITFLDQTGRRLF